MQKKLIAIVVAAALAPAAAMADNTVYGRIHMSVDNVTGSTTTQSEKLSVNSNSSRFGVKGSEDLADGLKAVYQIEASVQANGGASATGTAASVFNGVRDTYIGLAGGFGTFLAGRLPAENQYVYDSNLFADQLGDAANFTSGGLAGTGRANGALHYVSPDMSGFNVALTYLPGTSLAASTGLGAVNTTNVHGKNSYGLKMKYAANGVTAALTYFNAQAQTAAATTRTLKPLSVAGSYDFGNGMVTAQYVKNDDTTTGGVVTTKQTIWNIGGKFNVASNAAIKAQYSHAGTNNSAVNTGAKMFALGYDYALSKRTGVYAVYASASNDAAATFTMAGWGHQNQNNAVAAGQDPKGFGVGLTHNF